MRSRRGKERRSVRTVEYEYRTANDPADSDSIHIDTGLNNSSTAEVGNENRQQDKMNRKST